MPKASKSNWFLDISLPGGDTLEWRHILLSKQHLFVPSKVFGYDGSKRVSIVSPGQRTSVSLLADPDVKRITSTIEHYIFKNLDHICAHLGTAPFAVGRTESSAVAFLSGGFFGKHNDLTRVFSGERVLSWVYYLTVDPLPFSGGDLVLFDGAKEVARLNPHSGRLLVFNSCTVHEVEPVVSTSGIIEDSRLTITGFIRRRDTLQDKLLDFLRRLLLPWMPRVVIRPLRRIVRWLTRR